MPYKDKQKAREYHKRWCEENKDRIHGYYTNNRIKILLYKKKYWKDNRDEKILYQRKLMLEKPWRSHYFNAKNRCTNKNNQDYKTYGGRGIKFLLTMDEIKELWIRDRAFSLHRATIDKIDNNGNYEFSNCRFIEQSENSTKGNYESRWRQIKAGLNDRRNTN